LSRSLDKVRIGVLALQGAFIEHIEALQCLKVKVLPVYLPKELEGLDGLIIPGGESTTISRLMVDFQLMQPLRDLAQAGFPILGTCAGMILLAREVSDFALETLGLMNIKVRRNAFGRQVDSFETEIKMPALGEQPFHAVFIRAPIIEKADSKVEILAKLFNGAAVAARQGKLVVAAFHPELTDDLRFHRYFLDVVTSN
jgi:5'-phosphate synthase pdxT subunit